MDGELPAKPVETTALGPKRWGWMRKVIMAVAVGLFLFGAKCLSDGSRRLADFEQWRTARPMAGAVDFSKPGHFTFPFDQTCSCSHDEVVVLTIPRGSIGGKAGADLLAGLEADLEIIDTHSVLVLTSAFTLPVIDSEPGEHEFAVFRFAPFPKGQYTATITVKSGATALQGIPQQIDAGYELCGLEALPGQIAVVIGAISAVLGLVVGCCACPSEPSSQVRPGASVAATAAAP